jgi:2-isopropylmalate synthase
VKHNGTNRLVAGGGTGPISAFANAMQQTGAPQFVVVNFKQHSLTSGTEACAIAYLQLRIPNGQTKWGAGIDTNIELASIKAVLSALNRLK